MRAGICRQLSKIRNLSFLLLKHIPALLKSWEDQLNVPLCEYLSYQCIFKTPLFLSNWFPLSPPRHNLTLKTLLLGGSHADSWSVAAALYRLLKSTGNSQPWLPAPSQ